MKWLALAWMAVAVALPACGGDSAAKDVASGDTGNVEDVTNSPDVGDDVTSGTLVFEPGPTDGEAVALTLVSLDETSLVIDVVTRGLHDDDQLFALGFRLTYDPAVLRLAEATPGEPWTSRTAMAKEGRPGIVVAGVAHPHAFFEEPGPPLGNVTLYRLRFDVLAVRATPLELVAKRSGVMIWPGESSPPERVPAPAWVGASLAVE